MEVWHHTGAGFRWRGWLNCAWARATWYTNGMAPSLITLIFNTTLVVIGILLTIILLRMAAVHEYYYGMSDIRRVLQRRMIVILFVILAMSFIAAVYNLIIPWLFGL